MDTFFRAGCGGTRTGRRGSATRWRVALTFAAALAAGAAAAAHRYVWTDDQGALRVTKDSPETGIPFEVVSVPDPIDWRRPPARPAEVPEDQKLTPENLFRQVSGSVLWVESRRQEFGPGAGVRYGAAVAIGENEALTNCHVVGSGKATLRVGAGADDVSDDVELAAANFDTDRCVLHVRGLRLQPVHGLRAIRNLEVGETVFAIGNPRGLRRTISQGLVSGVRDLAEQRLVQTTAPISPGSSGGGLFDARGNLVAITSFVLRESQQLNFAIPAEDYWP